MLTYECKVWTMTAKIEKKLLFIKNKILKIIYGTIRDNELNY